MKKARRAPMLTRVMDSGNVFGTTVSVSSPEETRLSLARLASEVQRGYSVAAMLEGAAHKFNLPVPPEVEAMALRFRLGE